MPNLTALIVVATVMFCVLGGVTLLAHIYNLNNIKSKTVGDGQHGTARFSTKAEIRKVYRQVPFTPEKWRRQAKRNALPKLPQGIIVGCQNKGGETVALVDDADVHCMMVVSTKMTFVTDDYLSDLGAFGVDPGDHFKIEGGAFVKARAELPVMENVNLITTADFFTPYSKDFGNIDVNWDVLISMKINKVLSATINTTLKYDNDVKTFDDNGVKKGAKVQFKEVLGIGLAYNF